MNNNFDIVFFTLMFVVFISYILHRRPVLITPQPQTGIIKGTTVDVAGKIVPGATVTLINPEDGTIASPPATSDAAGNYSFPLLAIGPYKLSATLKNPDGSVLQGDVDIELNSAELVVNVTMVNAGVEK